MRDQPSSGASTGFEELLNLLVLGELNGAQVAELRRQLIENPEAREKYLSAMEIEAMLHHEFPSASAVDRREAVQPKRKTAVIVWAVAAMVLISIGCFMLLPDRGRPVVATVHGSCVRIDADGRKHPLEKGEKLGEGSVVAEGNDAFVELRFSDASRATLSGVGELGVSIKERKRIRLRSGNLDVEMTPQPSGKAALIETNSALIEVVGTRFLVEAAAASTSVSVSHGAVRLKRLADGETIEVKMDRMAVASLDAGMAFEARPIASAGGAWSAAVEELDGGKFIAGTSPYYRAEAFRAGSDEHGGPVIHHGVSFRAAGDGDSMGLARMAATSELMVKFRVTNPDANVRIMAVCREANGGFVGNKQIKFRASEVPSDADGWRTIRRGISQIETITDSDFNVAGRNVSRLFISVLNPSDGLQVAGATITD